jgi:hypothetical protein
LFGASHIAHIKSTITAGSVYYYHESGLGSPKQHNFIVINIDPAKEKVLFLLCCTSQVDSRRKMRSGFPPETLVELTPLQYSILSKDTVVDCNDVLEHTIEEIARMFSRKKLEERPPLDIRLVKKLRQGVILSPIVDKWIREAIKEDNPPVIS